MVGMSCHGIAFLLFPFNNDNIKFYHPTKNEHEKYFTTYCCWMKQKKKLYKRNTIKNLYKKKIWKYCKFFCLWHVSSHWHPYSMKWLGYPKQKCGHIKPFLELHFSSSSTFFFSSNRFDSIWFDRVDDEIIAIFMWLMIEFSIQFSGIHLKSWFAIIKKFTLLSNWWFEESYISK